MASLCCGRSYALSPQLLIGLNRDTLTSLPPLWTSWEVFGRGRCEVIRLRCVRLQRQGPQTGIYIPIKTSTAELALETWWLNSHQVRKGHSVTRHAHILVMDFSLQAERKQVSDIGVMHFVKTAQDHLNNFAASWSLGALLLSLVFFVFLLLFVFPCELSPVTPVSDSELISFQLWCIKIFFIFYSFFFLSKNEANNTFPYYILLSCFVFSRFFTVHELEPWFGLISGDFELLVSK